MGVVAAGQLVQTGQDSKIDWKRLLNFRMFLLLLYLVILEINFPSQSVFFATSVALREISFLITVCLNYLVTTCIAISGQFTEAFSVSLLPTSDQKVNTEGLIQCVEGNLSNYLSLFSISCASDLPGIVQEASSESVFLNHSEGSISGLTCQLPFKCHKTQKIAWYQEEDGEEIFIIFCQTLVFY